MCTRPVPPIPETLATMVEPALTVRVDTGEARPSYHYPQTEQVATDEDQCISIMKTGTGLYLFLTLKKAKFFISREYMLASATRLDCYNLLEFSDHMQRGLGHRSTGFYWIYLNISNSLWLNESHVV